MCIRTAIKKINRAINAIKGINCLTALFKTQYLLVFQEAVVHARLYSPVRAHVYVFQTSRFVVVNWQYIYIVAVSHQSSIFTASIS